MRIVPRFVAHYQSVRRAATLGLLGSTLVVLPAHAAMTITACTPMDPTAVVAVTPTTFFVYDDCADSPTLGSMALAVQAPEPNPATPPSPTPCTSLVGAVPEGLTLPPFTKRLVPDVPAPTSAPSPQSSGVTTQP